jgi:hypothetical protein
VGQKVLSKPSADSFAVGRRQKAQNPALMPFYNMQYDQRNIMSSTKASYGHAYGSYERYTYVSLLSHFSLSCHFLKSYRPKL